MYNFIYNYIWTIFFIFPNSSKIFAVSKSSFDHIWYFFLLIWFTKTLQKMATFRYFSRNGMIVQFHISRGSSTDKSATSAAAVAQCSARATLCRGCGHVARGTTRRPQISYAKYNCVSFRDERDEPRRWKYKALQSPSVVANIPRYAALGTRW